MSATTATAAQTATLASEFKFDVLNNEVGNTRRLLERYGSDIRYHKDKECWLIWNGKYWEEDRKGRQVAALMKRVLQEIRNETNGIIKELTPQIELLEATAEQRRTNQQAEQLEKLSRALEQAHSDLKHTVKSENDRSIMGSVRQTTSEPNVLIDSSELDSNPLLFNVLNGTVDLETMTLRPHRREDFITKIAPVVYDPFADAQRFDQFLEEVFDGPEVAEYMQRLCGYALTGYITERVVAFLMGTGANGKTALMRILLGVMGVKPENYGLEVSFRSFCAARFADPDKPRNDLVRFEGKRLITASEKDDPHARLDTEILKNISGNNRLAVRGNFTSERDFLPQAKIFLQMNNEPRITDTTDAMWDRVKKIPFNNRFPIDDPRRDPEISQKIIDAEASGVLNWMLQGCTKVVQAWKNHENALPEPDAVKNATMEYRENQSQVIRFFADTYRVTAQKEFAPVPCADVYKAYCQWADGNGEKYKHTMTAFGTELSRYLDQIAPGKTEKKLYGAERAMHWFGIEERV